MKKLPVESKIALPLSIRQRVETLFGQIKDNFMLISRKSRSATSFLFSALAALLAYMLKKKPSFLTTNSDFFTLPIIF
jgi:hypothetical protein